MGREPVIQGVIDDYFQFWIITEPPLENGAVFWVLFDDNEFPRPLK
jgi:hypothetical protein